MLPTESNEPLFKSTFFANPEPYDALVTLETTFLLALARLPARRLNAVAPSMLIHAASRCLTKSGDCAPHLQRPSGVYFDGIPHLYFSVVLKSRQSHSNRFFAIWNRVNQSPLNQIRRNVPESLCESQLCIG